MVKLQIQPYIVDEIKIRISESLMERLEQENNVEKYVEEKLKSQFGDESYATIDSLNRT